MAVIFLVARLVVLVLRTKISAAFRPMPFGVMLCVRAFIESAPFLGVRVGNILLMA